MTSDANKFPPYDLLTLPRWIVADTTKKPIPGTAAKDPKHWGSFDAALAKQQEDANAVHRGVSFFEPIENAGNTLVCIDLDSAVVDGEITDWAQLIVDFYQDTYIEKSASGTGLHVFLWVKDPGDYPNGKHFVDTNVETEKAAQIQVYGGVPQGYVAVTGDILEGSPDTIRQVPDLNWLRGAYPPGGGNKAADDIELETSFATDADLSHEAILERVLEQVPIELVRGDWQQTTHRGGKDWESASEPYWSLVHAVLKACYRDGAAAVGFLLDEAFVGKWADGTVIGTDPAKFAKSGWVTNNVKRAQAQTPGERPDFPVEAKLEIDALFPTEPADDEPTDSMAELGLLQWRAFREKFGGGAQFLIDGLVPRVGVVQIYAKPKMGKSLVALSLISAVASGADECWGRAVLAHGPVMVMVGEDNFGVANRTRAQELVSEIDDDLPVFLTESPGNLTSNEGIGRAIAQVRAVRPRVVLIDTQIANAGQIDENSSEAVGRLFKVAERLAQTGQCLVVLVHHTGKNGKDARGSSVQAGAIVADFEVIKKGEQVRVIPRRSKNWKTPPEFSLTILEASVAVDERGSEVTAPAIDFREDPAVAAALEALAGDEEQVTEGAPAAAKSPAKVLTDFSKLLGRVPRAEAIEHAVDCGILATGTKDAMRHLEKSLVNSGQLVVDGTTAGVIYRAL